MEFFIQYGATQNYGGQKCKSTNQKHNKKQENATTNDKMQQTQKHNSNSKT